jgi:nitroreductase
MQTWEAITSRRNVRSFADRPIPAADLDQILEAGRRAPSSQNWQPWDFIVVTERGRLRELARVWRGAGHVAGSAATIVPASGSTSTSSHPSKVAAGGGVARPSITSQNGPSRVTRPFLSEPGDIPMGTVGDQGSGLRPRSWCRCAPSPRP